MGNHLVEVFPGESLGCVLSAGRDKGGRFVVFNSTIDSNWTFTLYLANVAIIAPRDEAISRDYDFFELACNTLGA